MSNEMEMFTEETTAALVVGRRGRATIGAIRETEPALQALGEKHGLVFTAIGHGDFATDEPDDDQETAFVAGLVLVMTEAVEPVAFDLGAVRDALAKVRAIPADEWTALTDQGLVIASDEDDEDDRTAGAWLVSFGPLANARVAYGVTEETAGLARIRGVDMAQEAQEAVYGVMACTTSYEEDPRCVDFSPDAHAGRVAALGGRVGDASYYLIATYD
jgi:hypothetical protein